ncbi:MAG: nuclear transport factor 2 family protein [Anaerolineales bacterium]|jgi:hypothetical protein
MTRISNGMFNKWLAAYGLAWEKGDHQKSADLFAEGASYQETPFNKPMLGKEAVQDYWQSGAGTNQRDISFSYRILSVQGNQGIAHWQASFQRVKSGNQVELDGILVAEFDEHGLCTDFKEWWHRQEEQEDDQED